MTALYATGIVDGMTSPKLRILTAFAAAAVTAVVLSACSPTSPTVATFLVAGDHSFKIELATPELIQHAKDLMAGSEEGRIPIGLIVRDDPSVNAPWSWHIDPQSVEFADVTTEVCDGLPEYVEDGTLTSPYYCPWSAQVVAIEGPDAD